METKVPSAITGIRLNRATFSDVPIEQLTFVNFFYGNNGTGKSSIARAIAEDDGIAWEDGASATDYDVLVFNQDYIGRNFADYDNLDGVFTVNEVNIEIQQAVKEKTDKRRDVETQLAACREAYRQKKAAPDALFEQFKEDCWNPTTEVRSRFDVALEGKKIKKGLVDALLAEQNPQEQNLDELKRQCDIAFDTSSRAYIEFSRIEKSSTYGKLAGKDLLDKVIVSSSDTPFASFMNAINATDWVRTGHSHYTEAANGKCPYCQQKLPATFEKDLSACFDAQYQQDVRDLQVFQRTYCSETQGILQRLEQNLSDAMPTIDLSAYKTKLSILHDRIEINKQRLESKVNEPTKVIALEDIDSLLLEIGDLIDAINLQIKANNDVVAKKRTTKSECKTKIIQHLAFMLAGTIQSYRDELTKNEAELKAIEAEGKKLKQEASDLTKEISQLNSKVVNTESTMISINRILRDSGFQGFSLRPKDGVPNTYEVIRDKHEQDGPAKGLSEGERNFIAFLYFYHQVRGSMSSDVVKDKIVVIDDPVSSMDSTALFIVSAIVREMINVCRNNTEYENPKVPGDYIKQLFILTHNVYFHREITYQQVGFFNCTSFYMIRKSDNISTIKLCTRRKQKEQTEYENYNPVQNSYAALWDELREVTSTIPALNTMRRILEYYFLQLCGYEGSDLREIVLERPENRKKFIKEVEGEQPNMTEYQLASSLLAYINNPHGISDGLNYIEETDDVDTYKRVFKKVFEALGQIQHYNMMSGTPISALGEHT